MGWFDGLEADFSARLQQMIADSGGRLSVVSGFRSIEEQTALWNGALAKYGSEDEARMWVAPPGSSNHNYGVAVDLGFETDDATAWAHANAARYGLAIPMDWEPWHIEPIGVRDGSYHAPSNSGGGTGHGPGDGHDHGPGTGQAYTTPPDGYKAVDDATRRADLGYQLQSLNGLLMSPMAPLSSGTQDSSDTALAPKPAAAPTQVV